MSQTLPVSSASLTSDLQCLLTDANWQSLVALLSVVVPTGFKRTVSITEPAPADRDGTWFRLNADGTPDQEYYYALGRWLSKHPDAPGKVIMYEGTEASIDTFDGGSVGAVTDFTGPFWERVTAMDAKFPIGPGTLPTAGAIAVGATGGEEEHVLTSDELPDSDDMFDNLNITGVVAAVSAGGTYTIQDAGGANQHRTVAWDGHGDAHNNLPPYRAIWFIRRTARLYRTAP